MKRLLYNAFLMLLPLAAGAQERAVSDRAFVENIVSRALWMGTDNAAGLAVQPVHEFNTLDFSYGIEDGSHALYQEGTHTGDFCFDTRGALAVGRMQLWGQFSYDNITVKDSRFNTVLFDPFDEREVFYVADPNPSGFRRQVYNMQFKAAMPLTRGMFAGLHVKYTDRIGAKQVDPRSESYKYSLDVRPSLVYVSGSNTFGISSFYSNMFERTVPTLSNASEIQDVYVLRGLGNYVSDIVGSGGLSTLFYRSNTYGGAVQYGRDGKLLVELKASHSSTHGSESATQPYKLGSTAMLDAGFGLQYLLPSGKISAQASYRSTDATEYSQIHNLSTGEYEVKASSVTANYSGISASAAYEHYLGASDSAPYVWKFAGSVAWDAKDDIYYLPETVFSYSNLSVLLNASRRFSFASSVLRAGLSGGYKLAVGSNYEYAGIHAADPPASDWYPHDIEILGASCARAGVSADWAKAVKAGTSVNVNASAEYLFCDKGRLFASVGLGLVF